MFFHMGEHRHENSLMFNGIHQEMVNNQIDAFSKAFLATTVACARCHDHKLDAVSQRDYYALASLFMTPRWTARDLDTPERHAAAISGLKRLRASIRAALARRWGTEAQRFAAELMADMAQAGFEPPEIEPESGRLTAWQAAFALPAADKDKAPALDTPADIGPLLRLTLQDGHDLAAAWAGLAARWRQTHENRTDFNARGFRTLADFRTPGLPAGWGIEGAGMRHGYVVDGTPLVSLAGDTIVQRLLPRGYHTHALSPRLAGSLRSPRLQDLKEPFWSARIAGGDWAGYLTVVQNAFLGGQTFLKNDVPAWTPCRSGHDVKRSDWTARFELATAALMPSFPPPHYQVRSLPLEEDGSRLNGWFSITGLVAHDQPGAPQDPLDHWAHLLDGPVPGDRRAAWGRVGQWLAGAVERWCADCATAGDVVLLNWLRERGLLSNRADADDDGGGSLGRLVAAYRALEQTLPPPRTINSMDERGMAAASYALDVRGNYDEPGDLVPHDFLQVFAGQNDVVRSRGSGRRELAEFLVSPRNPLTARVYVNRVWQWVFGSGLVGTPDDFGHLGEKPSHPELLDALTATFMADGWSTKRLVRRLVLSSTFRQSGRVSDAGRQRDPRNRLLHHYPTRRLDAEAIRDALLAVSGELDPRLSGPPIEPPRIREDPKMRLFSGPLDSQGRRSLYIKVSILEPPRFLACFNLPDPKIPTGRRDVTNVPAQALALLNDPFVAAQAESWARRLVAEEPPSAPAERLRGMFVRALGREPTPAELQRWGEALEHFGAGSGGDEHALLASRTIWARVAHALFNTKEFDTVATIPGDLDHAALAL
jgi:hypothetical protein